VRPNPSLERDLHRHGIWPAKRWFLSSASRAKRHSGSGPSAQTLGVTHEPQRCAAYCDSRPPVETGRMLANPRTATLFTLVPAACFGVMWATLFYGAGPHGIWNLTVPQARVVLAASIVFAAAATVFAVVTALKHKEAKLSAVVAIIGYAIFLAWAVPIALSIPW